MKKLILGIVITVSAVAPLFGVILPDGTDAPVSGVEKDSKGRILKAALSEPAYIQPPAGKLKLESVSFYESGKFKEGWLSEAQEVAPPAGKLKLKNRVSFYESGKLRSGILASTQKINGKEYTEGTTIGWDSKGKFLGKIEIHIYSDDFWEKMKDMINNKELKTATFDEIAQSMKSVAFIPASGEVTVLGEMGMDEYMEVWGFIANGKLVISAFIGKEDLLPILRNAQGKKVTITIITSRVYKDKEVTNIVGGVIAVQKD